MTWIEPVLWFSVALCLYLVALAVSDVYHTFLLVRRRRNTIQRAAERARLELVTRTGRRRP